MVFKPYYFRRETELLLVLVIGLIAGLTGWLLYANPTQAINGDSTYYYNTAILIKESINNLFTNPNIGIAESLNAISLGIIIKLPFNDVYEVFVFQLLLFSVTGLVLFKFGEELLGKKSAWVFFLFYAMNNKNWQWIYVLKPGVWVLFWISLILFYAYRLYRSPLNNKLLAIYSILIGALVLTDMRYIPHFAAFTFLIFISLRPILLSFRRMIIVFLIVLLSISPWLIREFSVFDRFIFISEVNTMVIQQTFAPEKFKKSWVYMGEMKTKDSLWLPDGRNLQHEELIDMGKLSRNQVNNLVIEKNAESGFIKRLGFGFKLWQPFKFKYSYEPLHPYKIIEPPATRFNNLNRLLTLGILYPFFFVGIIVLVLRKDMFGWGLISMLISHFFLHMFSYVDWRYLLTVLPVITLISIMGYNQLQKLFHQKKFWL